MCRYKVAPYHVEKTFRIENVHGQRPAISEEPPKGKVDTCDHRIDVVNNKDQQYSRPRYQPTHPQ